MLIRCANTNYRRALVNFATVATVQITVTDVRMQQVERTVVPICTVEKKTLAVITRLYHHRLIRFNIVDDPVCGYELETIISCICLLLKSQYYIQPSYYHKLFTFSA